MTSPLGVAVGLLSILGGLFTKIDYEKAALEKIQIEAGRIVSGATKSCSRAKILFELGWTH